MFKKAAVITLPRLEPHRPPISSAIIAAVCKQNNIETKSFDLNIELFHRHFSLYDKLDSILDGYRVASVEEENLIDQFLGESLREISAYNPDLVLVSIFSFTTHYFAKKFLKLARNLSATIVIGGQGVYVPELSRQELDRNFFGQTMLDQKLIDYYIVGEGEEVLNKFLCGEKNLNGVNNSNKNQILNINTVPWPDYSFFDLNKYDYLSESKEVFITSSRGCVRRCTYCDVPFHWPKYRWREGENVANEIIHNYEKFGITNFYFTDSLVNGSNKNFADMCNKLAAYNFDQKISWRGQFIIKPKNQVTDEYFDMISAAGGTQFYIGVETGSDKIRYEMDKKFTNEDIEYFLHHFKRTNMSMFFLMLTGYVTESLDDHMETMNMFPRWQKYVASGTISGIDLGPTLIILANTPLDHMREELGIKFLNNDPKSWISTINPELNIKERIRRRIELHKHAIAYNWPIWRGKQRLESIKGFLLGFDDKQLVNGSFD